MQIFRSTVFVRVAPAYGQSIAVFASKRINGRLPGKVNVSLDVFNADLHVFEPRSFLDLMISSMIVGISIIASALILRLETISNHHYRQGSRTIRSDIGYNSAESS